MTMNCDNNETFSRQVLVTNGMGLHARPAARLAQEAQKFEADIVLAAGETEVDAKSILDILSLAAGEGSALQIKTRGQDASKALEHITELFRRQFEED